jgi:protein-S-isoprenylcysteine O-methyltransferase Ste14
VDTTLLILSLATFTLVCLLPFIFFKKDGRFNLMWCLTASPYVIYPIILILGHLKIISPILLYSEKINEVLLLAAPLLYILSLITMALTLGTHRIPLALWHQDNDAPKSIITFGAYAKFRHPFYTSFILALIAGVMTFPYWASIAVTAAAISLLTITAKKEERKLSNSQFGTEYKSYMQRTGRFFPNLF